MDLGALMEKIITRISGDIKIMSDFVFGVFKHHGVSDVAVFRILWIISITICVAYDSELIALLLFIGMSIDPDVSSDNFLTEDNNKQAGENDRILTRLTWTVSVFVMLFSGHFLLGALAAIYMVRSDTN